MTLSPPIADATAPPFVDGRKVLCNGKVEPWTGPVQEVFAPIYKVSPPTSPTLALSHTISCASLRAGSVAVKRHSLSFCGRHSAMSADTSVTASRHPDIAGLDSPYP